MNVSIRKMDGILDSKKVKGLFGGTFLALCVLSSIRGVRCTTILYTCFAVKQVAAGDFAVGEHQAHRPVTYVGAFDAGAWHRRPPGVARLPGGDTNCTVGCFWCVRVWYVCVCFV